MSHRQRDVAQTIAEPSPAEPAPAGAAASEGVVVDLFRQQLIDHIPRLRAFAISLTRDAAQADDLVQEALLRAWRARGGFDGANLHAWPARRSPRASVSTGRKRPLVRPAPGSSAAHEPRRAARGRDA